MILGVAGMAVTASAAQNRYCRVYAPARQAERDKELATGFRHHCRMRTLPVACVALFACGSAAAQTATPAPTVLPAPSSSITTLETVSVTGVLPGPGLWKVSREGRVLWVLGVIPSLPARMRWRSAEVEQAIAGSQEVIESPKV